MHDATAARMPPWLYHRKAVLGDVVLALLLTVGVDRINGLSYGKQVYWISVLSALAVLLRRKFPVGVLAVTTAWVVVTMIVAWPPPGGMFLTLGVLTYSAALYSEHRRPWHHACLVWVAVMVAGSVADFTQWWAPDKFGLFAWIFGGAGVGDSVRMRRAYIAEVTERARQAEQTREEEARRRVIDERLRIARELHDVVAHHIAVISVHAGAAGHVLRERPEQVWPVLGHIREAADTVLEEIKSVVGVLRDPNEVPSTEPAPGLERLPELLAGLRAMDFPVRHEVRGTPRELPAVVDLAAYRIVQEALTNAHKHGAGSAVLSVEFTPDDVVLDVTNRIGRSTAGSGFGLIGMRERAAAAHGTITAGVQPGRMFRVHAILPASRGTDMNRPSDPRGRGPIE
ncbi:histidine kinase [Actinoplanes sp. HUAS TT8]|uniref:histidine kinase n=1 Tax=Actinoplanes sp. HUAS TT8 TaxID=3447453 RepID=UPI003F52833B